MSRRSLPLQHWQLTMITQEPDVINCSRDNPVPFLRHLFFIVKTVVEALVELPDGKSICPDPDDRTTGVSCVQIFIVWNYGKTPESLDMNARKSGERMKVCTWAFSVWDGLDMPPFCLAPQPGRCLQLFKSLYSWFIQHNHCRCWELRRIQT